MNPAAIACRPPTNGTVATHNLSAAVITAIGNTKPHDMKQRFTAWVDGLASGQDPMKVRIVLE